ncbi:RHS repeat-associated core domain-containing protein [Pseudomonas sp. RC10]|uniref:RHS repeat domain-containing protein n=1 Tax=Pseudomonas bambusae TaxID=3139142 RepID=UPI003138E030
MSDSMHRNTPSVTVYDSRGLTVRQVTYYRAEVEEEAKPRINAQTYDCQGRAVAAWDPRLFERQSQEPDLHPNVATLYSLSNTVLSSRSVDAGETISLSAESGVALEQWDARSTHWHTEYDEHLRPTVVHERMAGQPQRACERFTYGGTDADSASHNQCGELIRVDDSAGTMVTTEYGLLGGTLIEERRMLSLIEPPDWPPSAEERDALLEPGPGAITRRHFDATGTAISTTDARDHQQNIGLNIAGQLAQVILTLKGSAQQLLLRDMQYNAQGQVESQTAGNGVVSQYRYHPADGRLQTLKTLRPANDPLQSLTYTYDPVGNVVSIADDAQATRHFANQRIEPVNIYRYDSTYQLIEAQGRETAPASTGPQLPDLLTLPIDTSQWLNFTERYRYDLAGNMVQLRHEGRQPYTRDFEVDATSNRALIKTEGSAPPDFANGFDAGGNLQRLSPGQAMSWDARNRLTKIIPVSRKDAEDDAEHYLYDSSGQRVRKVGTSPVRAAAHTREVRYLPGLELRSDTANDEQLEVIVIQAGRCTVRCLRWLSGRPADIENDQLRYSVDDHLGSSTLELDGRARLISHEGYYPFGGTAWWAARSVVEAKYKVARYSGKERDASGLYYYGLRNYAPWLMRWISADPEGQVDGLNLYRMVRNSPINRTDVQGGLSVDFSLILGVSAVVLAIVIYALGQLSEARYERRQIISRRLVGIYTQDLNLTPTEAEALAAYYDSAAPVPASHIHVGPDRKGSLQIYQARTKNEALALSKAKKPHEVAKAVRDHGIPSAAELRPAPEKAPRQYPSNDQSPSVSAPTSARPSFDVAAQGTSTGLTADELRHIRERVTPGKRGSTASNASLDSDHEIAAPAPTSSAARQIFTMDPSGFFEDANIVDWLGRRPGMEVNLRAALDRFDPNRKGHTGLRGMKTTDIHSGTAGGRGDLRLGFTVRGNVFYPQAILSHKGKGTILAQRGA